MWSAATGACGLALNFGMLFGARVATAVGEAGGSPPSHSLISDYFPKLTRYERASNAPWSWAATCDNSEQWTPFAIAAGTLALLFNKPLVDFVMSAIGKITG